MNLRIAALVSAIIVVSLFAGGNMTPSETVFWAVVGGLIVLFIGWILTPFGRPLRQALEDWLYKPDPHNSQWLEIIRLECKPYVECSHSTINADPSPIQGELFIYRIGIVNKGDSTINDVEVKLTSIKQCPRWFNGVGGYFRWAYDNPPDGHPYLLKKSIPPTKQSDFSDAVFVDVLQFFWPHRTTEREHIRLEICHIRTRVPEIIPFHNYELIVTAHGQHQAIVQGRLRFEASRESLPILTVGSLV